LIALFFFFITLTICGKSLRVILLLPCFSISIVLSEINVFTLRFSLSTRKEGADDEYKNEEIQVGGEVPNVLHMFLIVVLDYKKRKNRKPISQFSVISTA